MSKNAKNTMLCWNPTWLDEDLGYELGKVALVPWPGRGRGKEYRMSSLACDVDVRESSFKQRKAKVFMDAIHLIVRDGIDPEVVHQALLGLEEYRDGCSDDMPGINRKE